MKKFLKTIVVFVACWTSLACFAKDAKDMSPKEVRDYINALTPSKETCRIGYTGPVEDRNLELNLDSKISYEEYERNARDFMKFHKICREQKLHRIQNQK